MTSGGGKGGGGGRVGGGDGDGGRCLTPRGGGGEAETGPEEGARAGTGAAAAAVLVANAANAALAGFGFFVWAGAAGVDDIETLAPGGADGEGGAGAETCIAAENREKSGGCIVGGGERGTDGSDGVRRLKCLAPEPMLSRLYG